MHRSTVVAAVLFVAIGFLVSVGHVGITAGLNEWMAPATSRGLETNILRHATSATPAVSVLATGIVQNPTTIAPLRPVLMTSAPSPPIARPDFAWEPKECHPQSAFTHHSSKLCAKYTPASPWVDQHMLCRVDGCGMWRRGIWRSPLDAEEMDRFSVSVMNRLAARGCKPEHFTADVNFDTAKFDHRDELHNRLCDFQYLDPVELLAVLRKLSAGRRIIICGDSMMRNLFMRLVALLRGQRLVVEHYFGNDAQYTVFPEGDLLQVTAQGSFNSSVHFKPGRDAILNVYYFRDTDQTMWRPEPLSEAAPLVIYSFMYWWHGQNAGTVLQPFLQRWERRIRESPETTFVFLTAPIPTVANYSDQKLCDKEQCELRNTVTKHFFRAPGIANIAHRFNLVDFDGIATVGPWIPKKDALHYQCSFDPFFPNPISDRPRGDGKGCLDPMNHALLQWIVHLWVAASRR